MKPVAPHGTRSRYFYRGCRCERCRAANTDYQRRRREPGWRGMVPADEARAHIAQLSTDHVGGRAVQDTTGVNRRTLYMITRRGREQIQARVADQILSVDTDARADSSLVPAGPTRQLIKRLIKETGLTRQEIARRLGSKAKVPQLQLMHRHVTARNELKVRRLWNSLTEVYYKAGSNEPLRRVK